MAAAQRTFTTPQPLSLDDQNTNDAPAATGRRRLTGAFHIKIERIEPDPNQPRKQIDPQYIEELARSIRSLGVLQPITVRYIEAEDRYRIIAGECRYTAAKQAGLSELPCWVKTPKAEDVLLEQIVENWQRSDLNPFELADSLAILRDANGLTQRQLAERTGKSTAEVSKLLTILDLDPEVQKLARADTTGRVTKRHLYSVARLPAPQQSTLLKRISRDGLSAVETEKLVTRWQSAANAPKKGGAPVTRRKFSTRYATVAFTYRKKEVADADLLAALEEVRQQIVGQSAEQPDIR